MTRPGTGIAPTRAGLTSDTHGLLRPKVEEALRGSDPIIHGGDIGDESLFEALRSIAPVIAGNNSLSDLQPDAVCRVQRQKPRVFS